MKRALPLVSLFLVAALVAPALAKARAPKAKTTKVSGMVAKVDATSLTVTVKKGKGAPAEDKTVEIGPTVKVQVQTAEDETVTTKKGKELKRPKVADGALADVKAGKRVTVTVAEDGKKAVSILVHRDRVGKKGK